MDPTKSNTLSTVFQEKLKKLLISIQGWKDLPEFTREYRVEGFMDTLGQLYLDYFQSHLEEANAIGVEFVQDLGSTAFFIQEHYVSYKDSIFRRIEWAQEDLDGWWLQICLVATNTQAFNEMFETLKIHLNKERIAEYLDYYNGESAHVTESDIPKNMPQTHWWWFY